MTETTWKPLLDGELADRAWRAIDDIARALENPPPVADELAGRNASLAGGSSGQSLFLTYLAMARDDEAIADLADQRLDHAIHLLGTTAMGPSLYSGFSGIAWTARHLEGRLFEAAVENEEDDIDHLLNELLQISPWRQDYDLIVGLAGYAVHALESLPRPTARRSLERIVQHFSDLMVDTPVGRSWFTPAENLVEHQREVYPTGYFNCGVAHGVPGVLAILARVAEAGIETERIAPMLVDATTWLLAQDRGAAGFPTQTSPDVADDGEPARLAWCYGDPGLALSLLRAARLMGRADWEAEALRIAKHSLERPTEASGVHDAGLCHGAVGLAHLYNRLDQATGDTAFADGARSWYEKALDMHEPGTGVGGFKAFFPHQNPAPWVDEPGFLMGSAGIGLGLLAAVTDLEPDWDRVMAIDVPPISP